MHRQKDVRQKDNTKSRRVEGSSYSVLFRNFPNKGRLLAIRPICSQRPIDMSSPIEPLSALGIDIGGANLKLANSRGESLSTFFPMWIEHRRLADRLKELVHQFCQATREDYKLVALTMTGEMADCFASRRAGVAAILDQVQQAFPELPVSVYAVDGTWLTVEAAGQDPWRVASSNWHALANWIVQYPVTRNPALRLVVDIGSTTVDVLPVEQDGIVTTARTDGDRLKLQQLVYTGMSRTPIAAIVSSVCLNGSNYPLVAERFATSDDAYVVLGLVAPDEPRYERECEQSHFGPTQSVSSQIESEACDTADGRSRSLLNARARLARMLGEDSERLTVGKLEDFAQQIIAAQAEKVASAICGNLPQVAAEDELPVILFSGHGRGLATAALQLVDRPVRSIFLDDLVSQSAARCAPAMAVAWLLENQQSK